MTSDGNLSVSCHPSNNSMNLPFFFQRRNERLDWRKIASLDLNTLIQDGDTDQLTEFITPILFCRADSEFDEKKTDPGFIKVFRLCQLIGEYLKTCSEKESEKLKSVQNECIHVKASMGRLNEELGSLRESLSQTKKELKKTKDILASTQTQLLGSDNLDEVDQCPYCNKYFLSPSLLLAHLHRRHQGLSIPVSLQAQNIASNVMFPVHNVLPQCCSSTTFSPKRLATSVSGTGLGGTPTVYAFTLSPDGTVVNQNQNNNQNLNNNQNQNAVGDFGNEELRQGFLTEIKLCFSTTSATATSVTSSSTILRPSSSTEDKVVVLTPPPEYSQSRGGSSGESEIRTSTNRKQELEQYREIPGNKNKSENPNDQNGGRSQVRQIGEAGPHMEDEDENDNENKNSGIKEDESVTHIFQRFDKSSPVKVEVQKNIPTQNDESTQTPNKLPIHDSPPPTSCNSIGIQTTSNYYSDEKTSNENVIVHSVEKDEATQTPNKLPLLAPTSFNSIGIQTSSNYSDERKSSPVSKSKSKSPSPIVIPVVEQLSPEQRPKSKSPLNVDVDVEDSELSDYSISSSAEEYIKGILLTDDSGDGYGQTSKNRNKNHSGPDGDSLLSEVDDVISDYDEEDDDDRRVTELSKGESRESSPDTKINRQRLQLKSPKRKYVFDAVQGKLIDACETKSQIDLVRDRIVQDELDVQLENLGLDPEASSLGIEEMGRALQHLKARRGGGMMDEQNSEKFESGLSSLRKEIKYEVTKTVLAQDVNKYVTNRKLESNRFTNMLSKVKKSGVHWKQKVATAIKGRQESKQMSTNPEIKTTFFSKWGRRKKSVNKDEEAGQNQKHLNQDEDSGDSSVDEDSSSDVPMHPYMTRSRPILRQSEDRSSGRHSRKRSRESESRDWDSVSDSEEDSHFPNENPVVGSHPTPKIFHSSPTSTSKSNPARHLKQNPFQYQPQPISPIRQQPQDDSKPKPKPRPDKGKAPMPPTSTSTWELHGNLMSELKNKIQTSATTLSEESEFQGATFVPLKGNDSTSSVSSVSTATARGRRKASTIGMDDKKQGGSSSRGLQHNTKGKIPNRNSWDSSD